MIDTHCHLFLEQFDKDREDVLHRARETGITDICMPAINLKSLSKMDQIKYPGINLHKMAGIHPTDIKANVSGKLDEQLMQTCSANDIVAVGETGLDFYWSTEFVEAQKKSLHIHCKVAKALEKPIVLHNRASTVDLLNIIEEEQDGSLNGVWHCFTGTEEEGKKAIDLGLKLGIGGVFTFKNAGVDKVVARLPLEVMLLETDAPYLAPTPERGKRNEPAFIRFTAQKLADVFETSIDAIQVETTKTARTLFSI